MIKKILKRSAILLVVLILISLAVAGWIGSGHLVSPPRRALQDYHRDRLADPASYGLVIQSYIGPGGSPCLLVEPRAGGRNAVRGREIREALPHLPPWGEIRGLVVMLNGHGGRKEDHLPVCERFCAAGFRCLLPELPGHGDHPSTLATFGKNEAEWIEACVDDFHDRFAMPPQPVILYGVSQGGAIALQTAARHPDRWAGVISTAAFASLDRVIRSSAADLAPRFDSLAPLLGASVGGAAWVRAGFLPSDISPLNSARRLQMPVMLVHGKQDELIPYSHAEEIFAALPSGRKILRPVEGAGHSRVLATDSTRLFTEMAVFLIDATQATHSDG